MFWKVSEQAIGFVAGNVLQFPMRIIYIHLSADSEVM